MFFRNYIFIFLAVAAQTTFAGELNKDETVNPESETLAKVALGVAAFGAAIYAAPALIAIGTAVTAKALAIGAVATAKTIVAAGATKTTLVAIGPTVSKIYLGVNFFKLAHWLDARDQEKKNPTTEQKLKKLVQEEEKEKSFEDQLNEAYEWN